MNNNENWNGGKSAGIFVFRAGFSTKFGNFAGNFYGRQVEVLTPGRDSRIFAIATYKNKNGQKYKQKTNKTFKY